MNNVFSLEIAAGSNNCLTCLAAACFYAIIKNPGPSGLAFCTVNTVSAPLCFYWLKKDKHG
jgi:hypothetical protein